MGPIEQWLLDIQPEQSGFTDTSFPNGGDLMGARLVDPAVAVGDWECTNTQGALGSRFYDGTGLADGDRLRNLVGHEFTGSAVDKPGLEILAEGHLMDGNGRRTETGMRQRSTRGRMARSSSTPRACGGPSG